MGTCDGWTVVEMASGSMATSLAGMVLADNGARVVKVEPPEGDRLRTQSPSGFLVWNRGKESVIADLRTAQGQADVRDMIARSDVVLEGFAAGQAHAWRLGYEDLEADHPGLVYCSVKGFGSTGAYAALKGYEGIVAAKAGLFARGDFGFRDGPIFPGAPFASHGAAQMAVAGVIAALIARESTGQGQRVEATMINGLNPLDYFGTMHWQYAVKNGRSGHVTLQGGEAMRATRYFVMVPTRDGRFISIVPQLPHQAHALSRAVGLEWTIEDPRFADQAQFANADDAQAWEDLLWERFSAKDLEEWLPILQADSNIPFEVNITSEEGLDHPQVVHNGNVVTVDDPELGPVREIGPLAIFGGTPSRIERSAPPLGVHDGPLGGPVLLTGTGTAPASLARGPLSGTTIVEFGYFYAMPYGVTMAAALGARVIKLEPLAGDPMRNSYGAAETGAVKTMEGKESIALDASKPEAVRIVHALAAEADAFVCGFRPGVDMRLGIDYATLAKINPRLVYLYATGYGVDGPYSHRPNYASSASAMCGNLYRQSAYWCNPEAFEGFSPVEMQAIVLPRLRTIVDGDANAALVVLSSLLLALAHQRRTGQGQVLSTSMINSNAYCYSDDFNSYAGKPPIPLSDDEQFGLHALYRCYRAQEGWVFLAAPSDAEWRSLTAAVARPDLAADVQFATAEARAVNDQALVRALAEVLAGRKAAEWEESLTSAGVGCVEIFEGGHSAFTCTDPVMAETGLTVQVDHPLFGRIVRPAPCVSLSATPAQARPSCLLGQHTDQILTELGYSAAQIAQLERDGVVGALRT